MLRFLEGITALTRSGSTGYTGCESIGQEIDGHCFVNKKPYLELSRHRAGTKMANAGTRWMPGPELNRQTLELGEHKRWN